MKHTPNGKAYTETSFTHNRESGIIKYMIETTALKEYLIAAESFGRSPVTEAKRCSYNRFRRNS